jgi:hypothetical protein
MKFDKMDRAEHAFDPGAIQVGPVFPVPNPFTPLSPYLRRVTCALDFTIMNASSFPIILIIQDPRREKMNIKQTGFYSIFVCGLILVTAFGYQALSVRNVKATANSPVGTWTVTVTPEGNPSFIVGVIFSSDGTMSLIEAGCVGVGVWEKSSGNQYAFSLWEYCDQQDGTFLKSTTVSTFELSKDKEQYTGPFYFQVLDLDGNVLFEGNGTATGVRDHVEAMP